MKTTDILPRTREFDFYHIPQPRSDVFAEILSGLSAPQKTIDPKFFYDTRGSQLYEKITQTEDYYLTRAENEILRRSNLSIAALIGRRAAIVEPGAGNCSKIEYLLDALRPDVYVPVDVASVTLESACARLVENYLWLDCVGVVADFNQLDYVTELLPNRQKIAFFPGSTLGNMEPDVALLFLRRLRALVGREGGILIGLDNVKDEAVLNRAYNDSEGVTAAFNKNVLQRLNRIAGADFEPEYFSHRAFFNARESRIEMHLVSLHNQRVQIGEHVIALREGETIHTENSYKYTRESFCHLADQAGLQCVRTWHDQRDYFTLYYLVPSLEKLIATDVIASDTLF